MFCERNAVAVELNHSDHYKLICLGPTTSRTVAFDGEVPGGALLPPERACIAARALVGLQEAGARGWDLGGVAVKYHA